MRAALDKLNSGIHAILHVCTFENYRGRELETTELVCTGKAFSSLCPSALERFPHVRKLVITNTSVRDIPKEIEKLPKLEVFEFTKNTAGNTLRLDRLACLPKLKKLVLAENCLESLSFERAVLQNLETLDLQTNNLERLPENIESLTNLKTLDLSENKIVFLSDRIGALKNLKTLLLSKNGCYSLCLGLTRLEQLEELVLDGNLFEQVPLELCVLNKLRYLCLSNNRLTTLEQRKEAVVHFYEELVTFHAMLNGGHTRFSHFFDGGDFLCFCSKENTEDFQVITTATRNRLFGLKQLCVLNVEQNMIEEIPDEIAELQCLEYFYAARNQLRKVPVQLGNMPSLLLLDFSDNSLVFLPFGFGCSKEAKGTLQLRNNRLRVHSTENYMGTEEIKRLSFKCIELEDQRQ